MSEHQQYQLTIDQNYSQSQLNLAGLPELEIFYLDGEPDHLELLIDGRKVLIQPNDQVELTTDRYHYLFSGRFSRTGYSLFLDIERTPLDPVRTYDLNQIFTLELAENPTTGYQWSAQTSSGLELLGSSYSQHCEEGITGCGGIKTFILRGTAKGAQKLVAKYQRDWESEPIKTKIFNFLIY